MDLVQDWFRVWEDRPGLWVIEEPLHSEVVKSHLVIGSEWAALIDTGMGVGDIKALVETLTALPIVVIQSHAHNDHVGGAAQFDEVWIHPAEAAALARGQSAARLANWFAPSEMSGALPPGFEPVGYSIPGKEADGMLLDGQTFDLGGRVLEVVFAPGHSAGGIVLLDRDDRTMISTDVVYLRELYLLNPDSSINDYIRTLERLVRLVQAVDRLYPSHGPTPIMPDIIAPMLAGMHEIAAGRVSNSRVDQIIEGGRDDVAPGAFLATYDFDDFAVLITER